MTASGRARATSPRRWRAPRAPRLRAAARRDRRAAAPRSPRRSARAGAASRCRRPTARAGLGVDQAKLARRREPASRGSRISTASSVWRPPSACSGRAHRPGRPAKSETTTTSDRAARQAAEPRQGAAEAGVVTGHAVGGHALAEGAAQADGRARRPPRGGTTVARAVRRSARDRLAPPRRTASAREERRPRPRRRRTSAGRRCRTPSRRDVESEPGRQRALRARARTCGMPVRAWPRRRAGGRRRRAGTGASARARCPCPRPAARCSPGSAPAARRRERRGRAPRPARPASGPGPGARRGGPATQRHHAHAAGLARLRRRGIGRRRRRARGRAGRRADAVGERLVGQHEPVAQHVAREVAHVLGQRRSGGRAAARAPARPGRG